MECKKEEKNAYKILKYSAEIGHYISDAHVPLHATENSFCYTKKGFMESRVPELFFDGFNSGKPILNILLKKATLQ